jgi:pilus assembly protein CpaE
MLRRLPSERFSPFFLANGRNTIYVEFKTMSISHQPAGTLQAAGSRKLVMPTSTKDPDALESKVLSVALIGAEERRRNAVAKALAGAQANVIREFSAYPELDDVPRLLEAGYDVVIVELDSNPELALDLVESICGNSSITVMVYSSRADSEMLVRCMRAGAREFLTEPIALNTIAEALVRASVRRPAERPVKKTAGKQMVFIGAKGGSGVTTVAANFAVSLAQQSGQRTVLIDLNLPFGDAALDLGINAQYSTANAMQNLARLDYHFLSSMLIKHSSGLFVLAAPDRYTQVEATNEAVQKLLTVARQNFDYVVVDAGSRFSTTGKALFEDGSAVYLITQIGITELRNSNRLISEFIASGTKLEIVLNRYTPRTLGIDEESITKALTMPAQWKIPSDYPAARNAQNTATPLALDDSPISRVIKQMTRTACGLPANPEKKKRFNLFG